MPAARQQGRADPQRLEQAASDWRDEVYPVAAGDAHRGAICLGEPTVRRHLACDKSPA